MTRKTQGENKVADAKKRHGLHMRPTQQEKDADLATNVMWVQAIKKRNASDTLFKHQLASAIGHGKRTKVSLPTFSWDKKEKE